MAKKFWAGLTAIAFCFIISLPASAQDVLTSEKKALIKELIKLLNATVNSEAFANQMMEKMREPFVTLVSQGLRQEFANQKLSPTEERRLKSEADEAAHRILDRIRAEIPKRINIDEVVEQFSFELYGKHFSEEELKELIGLYKSPTAQKFARIFPQIYSEALPRLEGLMKPALSQLVSELITEEKKRLKTR